MEPSTGLIVRTAAEQLAESLTQDVDYLCACNLDETEYLKSCALETASQVVEVKDAGQNAFAVVAQQELLAVRKAVETQRVNIKAPALKFGSLVDHTAKEFIKEITAEEHRIAALRADYESLILSQQRAAEAAENNRLAEIERAKARDIAAASSHEQIDSIQAKYDLLARAEAPLFAQPTKPTGSRVAEVWDITVVDVWALARSHSQCVTITPNLTEIKALLNAGLTVQGVTAHKTISASVRLPKEPKAIEV